MGLPPRRSIVGISRGISQGPAPLQHQSHCSVANLRISVTVAPCAPPTNGCKKKTVLIHWMRVKINQSIGSLTKTVRTSESIVIVMQKNFGALAGVLGDWHAWRMQITLHNNGQMAVQRCRASLSSVVVGCGDCCLLLCCVVG